MSTRTELESTLEWKNCTHRLASGFLKHPKILGSAGPNLAESGLFFGAGETWSFFHYCFSSFVLLGAEEDDLPKTEAGLPNL